MSFEVLGEGKNELTLVTCVKKFLANYNFTGNYGKTRMSCHFIIVEETHLRLVK